MRQIDRGNQPTTHDHRRFHLMFITMIMFISSILFLIYWGNEGGNRDWRFNLFIVGSGLIILGCLIALLFELINKKSGVFNIMGSLFLSVGGILYFIGAIGIAIFFAHHNRIGTMTDLDNPDSVVDIKDAMYWFGLHTLIAIDGIVLAMDCSYHSYLSLTYRLLMWSFPLLWTSWFAFGYWLCYSKNQLTWWELTGEVGFGIIATSILLYMIVIGGLHKIHRFITWALISFAFIGSILFWIYCGALIKKHVNNGHTASLYIGLPFLITGQIMFLHHHTVFRKI